MRKIPLQISITSDATQLQTAFAVVKKEVSELNNTDVAISLKTDTKDIIDGLKQIYEFADKKAADLRKNMPLPSSKDYASKNAELQKMLSLATNASDMIKKVQHEIESVADTMAKTTTKARLAISKDLELLATDIKTKFKDARKEKLVDVNALRGDISTLQAETTKLQNHLMLNLESLTQQQIRHANKVVETNLKTIRTLEEQASSFDSRNLSRLEATAKKYNSIKLWERVNNSDRAFADAKQQMESGRADKINLNQLRGSLGASQRSINKLEAEYKAAESMGDIQKAQEIQRLLNTAQSRHVSHRATYSSIANKFGTYEDVVAGNLRTKQATEASNRRNAAKYAIDSATMKLGSGQALSASELSALTGFDKELEKSQNALKRKLKNKTGSKEELDEVAREYEAIKKAREQYNLKIENLQRKHQKQLLKDQEAADKQAKKHDDDVRNQKYLDLFNELNKNRHLIKSMSYKEALENRNALAGMGKLISGDPEAAETLASLRNDLTTQMQSTRGRTFSNYLKGMVGIKGRNNPFGNANSDLFHQANKRVTNVAQMLGTSLYGMGIAGLGSAIIGGTIQSAAEKETMILTLAGMSNSNMQFLDAKDNPVSRGENLMRSIQHANKLYERIRGEAKNSLMTTSEFAEGYLTGAPRLRNSGFTEDQSLEITKKILMLGRATGLTSTAIMSDIRDFAAGNINSRSQVLMAAGLRKEELQKAQKEGGSDAMFKYFQEKMASFTQAFEYIANTPAGRINAFKIELEQLQQTLGEKLVPILIPALERFRGFIAKWVESGEAEQFVVNFGEFVNNMARIGQKFLEITAPMLKDIDKVLIIGVAGGLLRFAGQLGLLTPLFSNPITGILAALTALATGILLFRQNIEDQADELQKQVDEDRKSPNEMLDRDAAQKYVNSQLSQGRFSPQSIKRMQEQADATAKASLFRETFVRLDKSGVFGSLGGPLDVVPSQLDVANAIKNARDINNLPVMKGGIGQSDLNIYPRQLITSLRGLGLSDEDIRIAATQASKDRDVAGSGDKERLKGQLNSQRIARGSAKFIEAYNRLKPIVEKELGTKDPKKVQPEIAKRIREEEEKSISTYIPNIDEEDGKKSAVTLNTRLDVFKAYAKTQYETMTRQMNNMPDTMTNAKGRYIKPDVMLKGLAGGVKSAIANYDEYVQQNLSKGIYTVGIANSELLDTMQKLKDSFLEQIKTVQENIATQKEQNRSLRENLSLQEKANAISKAKFELSRMNPRSEGYTNAAIKLAFQEFDYAMLSSNANARAQKQKIAIEKLKYGTDAEVISRMTPDQQALYKKIMAGNGATYMVPSEIFEGNTGKYNSAIQQGTNDGVNTPEATASIKDMASKITTTVTASCAQYASKLLQKTGVGIAETLNARDLMQNVLSAGGTVVNTAQAGDLVVKIGKDYGSKKYEGGVGYHVGVALDSKTMADSSGGENNRRRSISVGNNDKLVIIRPKRTTSATTGKKGSKPTVDVEKFADVFTSGNPVTAIQNLFENSGSPISKDMAEEIAIKLGLVDAQAISNRQQGNYNLLNSFEQLLTNSGELHRENNIFNLGQQMNIMGLTGDALKYQMEQNNFDKELRTANEKATAYRKDRNVQFGNKLILANFLGKNLDADAYTKETEATALGMTSPIEIAKKKSQIEYERNIKYQENLANISEKLATNFERLAELDFSKFMEAIQNPYARITDITNPVQALMTRVQENMQNQIDMSEVDIANQQMMDNLYGIQREPGFYDSMRRDARQRARATARQTLSSKMPGAYANQTRNAVGANILSALTNNAYGMLIGGNGVDVAGILSPFTNMANSKFAQAGDVLTSIVTKQPIDINKLIGTPYEQFIKDGKFDEGAARKYASNQLLGKIGGNLAGNYIGGQIFAGKDKGAISLGTDLGGMAASMGMLGGKFAGPMGIVAGSILGSLVGGLFGGRQVSAEEERFRQRQKEHFDKMEKLAEENNKLLRPSYDVYNTIKGDVLYGSSSRWFSSKAYSPLGNQVQLGTR
jgi:hypothetical protein